MKIIPFLFLLVVINTKAKSQDVDIDKFYFKTTEIDFPKKILAPEKRTYTYTSLNSDTLDFNENEAIQLNGFKKTDKGVVEVMSMYGAGLHWDQQRTNVRADVSTKANFYSISVAAVCDGRIRLECKELDYKWYILDQFRRTYGTKEFATEAEAAREFNSLLKGWREDAKIAFKKFVVGAPITGLIMYLVMLQTI